VTQSGYYTASFSPQAGYYVLSHEGPSVPWQKVAHVTNSCKPFTTDDPADNTEFSMIRSAFNYVLTDNQALNETLLHFQSPVISHSTIISDGYELNAVEMRPPGMDDSGRVRYPVLFRV
jgi:dipeptidyl aminopeptidase B